MHSLRRARIKMGRLASKPEIRTIVSYGLLWHKMPSQSESWHPLVSSTEPAISHTDKDGDAYSLARPDADWPGGETK